MSDIKASHTANILIFQSIANHFDVAQNGIHLAFHMLPYLNFTKDQGHGFVTDDQNGELSSVRLIDSRYSNYFQIGHNAFEFILDFGQFHQASQGERFHTRIVTSPFYLKVLVKILQDSVKHYEEAFGVIPEISEYEIKRNELS